MVRGRCRESELCKRFSAKRHRPLNPSFSPRAGRRSRERRRRATRLAMTNRSRDASASKFYARRSAIGETHLPSSPSPFAFLFLHKRRREAERRQTRVTNRRILRCGAHPAGRARLSAFHHGSHLREYLIPKARLQARLPGTWSERALPAFACPSPGMHLPSRSSCREADTQAARERTANPPAGTAPAPPFGLPPEGVLRRAG